MTAGRLMNFFNDPCGLGQCLLLRRIATAVFYGVISCVIVVVNKTVLTSWQFPSVHFLGFGQMLATLVVLFVGKKLKLIDYADFSVEVSRKIWPLPLIHFGNLVLGLGSTKHLSLPMFTVLRRFSILMTMIGEYYILSVHQPIPVLLSIAAMVAGALVAASDDLAFDAVGYVFVLSSDFFTAAYGVCVKKKLDSKELGPHCLMFYSCLYMIVPSLAVCWYLGEVELVLLFPGWYEPFFVVQFLSSCVIGVVLIYSTILCTAYNSALTTAVVGCLKNILITYVGMFVGGDYVFSILNFIGLNVSVVGSLVYSYVAFMESEAKELPLNNPGSAANKELNVAV